MIPAPASFRMNAVAAALVTAGLLAIAGTARADQLSDLQAAVQKRDREAGARPQEPRRFHVVGIVRWTVAGGRSGGRSPRALRCRDAAEASARRRP